MVEADPQLPFSLLGIQVDIHDGSYLQHGVSTIYRDSAVRRGIIDGKHAFDWLGEQDGTSDPAQPSHIQLRKAIIAALTPGLHPVGLAADIIHPSADPPLTLVSVQVCNWGPHAYFDLPYRTVDPTMLQ